MQDIGLTLLLIVAGAGVAMLARQSIRAAHARRLSRLGYFDHCRSLFSGSRLSQCATGFPRLSGRYRNSDADLQAVPDTLTFRKLPALWVLVTLPGPLPVLATFNLMIRPTGVEPFSGFHRLPDQIAIPDGFPGDCAIRTDDPRHLLPEHVLAPHLPLFDNPLIKELVISPKGLRIVFLAEEADRTRYLIFRDAEMGRTPLPPEQITPVLERLQAIKTDIERYGQDDSRRAA